MGAAPHISRDHCLSPERVDASTVEGGRYGRMFDLPALNADESEHVLHELGAAGGFCDGGDREGDARVEAGWPFFGQYVAHDLTADRSPLRAHADLDALHNMRSPRANLESLYGGGPAGSPYLYCRDDPAKLLEDDGDLPRNQEGIALIGDPRNDVHVFVSQMQLAFIRVHNLLVDRLARGRRRRCRAFDEARRALTWHYQWLILEEFLPVLVGIGAGRRSSPRPAPAFTTRTASRSSRSSSPTLPTATAIRRYASCTSSSRTGPLHPVFPDLIGFCPSRRPPRRLVAAVRRPRSTSCPARQADRRSTAALLDPAPGGDQRRGRRRRLPLARHT